MANDFGLRVGVDGEAEFKRALKEINSEMKTLGSEAKLVASQFDDNDKSVAALAEKSKVLTKQLDEQKKKVDLLADGLQNAKEKYGENSAQAQEWQRKLYEAQAEVNKMNRELDKMSDALAAASEAEYEAAHASDKYKDSIAQAGKASDQTSGSAQGMGASFKASSVAIVAACVAIVKAIKKVGEVTVSLMTDAAEYADEINTQAKVTGISTQRLQEYKYAADLVDVSLDTLTSSMRKNIQSMNNAQRGTEAYANVYKELGVQIIDNNGRLRDSEDVYWEIIDALGKVENETERDAMAMQILGRSAQDLNPLIIAGSEAMERYAQMAHESGAVLSQETLNSYNDTKDSLDKLSMSYEAVKLSIVQSLMPALREMADRGSEHLGKFAKALQDADGDMDKIQKAIKDELPKAIDELMNMVDDIVVLLVPIVSEIVAGLAERLPEIIIKSLGAIDWLYILKTVILSPFGYGWAYGDEALFTEEDTSMPSENTWQRLNGNGEGGYWQSDLVVEMQRQNDLLQQIAEKETVVAIGDEEIGRANARWQNGYGSRVTGGGYD